MPTIEVISETKKWFELEEVWDSCLDQDDPIAQFLKFRWYKIWYDAFSSSFSDFKLHILQVSEKNQVLGFIPMFVHKRRSLLGLCQKMEFIRNEHTPKIDLICSKKNRRTLAIVLMEHIQGLSSYDIIEFNELLVDSSTSQSILENLSTHPGKSFYKLGPESTYLSLQKDWNQTLKTFSKSLRKDIRRCREKFDSQKSWDYLEVTTKEDIEKYWPTIESISIASWQHKNHTGIFASKETASFYKELMIWSSTLNYAYLAILMMGGKGIAYKLTLVKNNIAYGIKKEFDSEYNELSPGTFLDACILERLGQKGVDEYDFGAFRYSHKMRWSKKYHQHIQFFLYAPTFYANLLYFTRFPLKRFIKKILG